MYFILFLADHRSRYSPTCRVFFVKEQIRLGYLNYSTKVSYCRRSPSLAGRSLRLCFGVAIERFPCGHCRRHLLARRTCSLRACCCAAT